MEPSLGVMGESICSLGSLHLGFPCFLVHGNPVSANGVPSPQTGSSDPHMGWLPSAQGEYGRWCFFSSPASYWNENSGFLLHLPHRLSQVLVSTLAFLWQKQNSVPSPLQVLEGFPVSIGEGGFSGSTFSQSSGPCSDKNHVKSWWSLR